MNRIKKEAVFYEVCGRRKGNDADHADIRFFQKEIWQEIITFFKTKL